MNLFEATTNNGKVRCFTAEKGSSSGIVEKIGIEKAATDQMATKERKTEKEPSVIIPIVQMCSIKDL